MCEKYIMFNKDINRHSVLSRKVALGFLGKSKAPFSFSHLLKTCFTPFVISRWWAPSCSTITISSSCCHTSWSTQMEDRYLTDGTSVRCIDLRGLVRGGGVGVGVCLSQTGRWRAVSDMQSHSQRPQWGGTSWGHPSLYITFSRKDIKSEG